VVEIPANAGAPYRLSRTSRDLVKLSRQAGEREVFLLLSRADAIAVADALVDFVEGMNN